MKLFDTEDIESRGTEKRERKEKKKKRGGGEGCLYLFLFGLCVYIESDVGKPASM